MQSYEFQILRLLSQPEVLTMAPGGGPGVRSLNLQGWEGWQVAGFTREQGRDDSYLVILQRPTSTPPDHS